MVRVTATVGEKPKPVEVRVDHPFCFAIQHRPSGACLFLGRITEPGSRDELLHRVQPILHRATNLTRTWIVELHSSHPPRA